MIIKNNTYNYVCNNILKDYHICINKTDIVNKCNKIKINLKIYCNKFISK